MTEEVKQEVVKEEVKEEVKQTTPELTEVEKTAYEEGWRPKEEFSGETERWVPAKEFMDRKPLFQKIDGLKSEAYQSRREIMELKKTLNTLVDHHKKVRQTEYQHALEDLKLQRRAAMEDQNLDAVDAIQDKMEELKQDKTTFERQIAQENKQVTVSPTPEFVKWVGDNPWYHTDKEMHDFADATGATFLQGKTHATPTEVFEHVNKQIKRAYPEKFDRKTSRPSPVDSGDGERPSRKTDDVRLSPEEETVARRFEERGIMTRKQYAEELKRMNKRS